MSAPGLLVGAMEVALNRFLRLEPDVLAQCAELRGRVIGLAVAPLNWQLYIEFLDGGVRVADTVDGEVDVAVAGALPDILRMAAAQAGGGSSLPRGLQIHGVVMLLNRFREMLVAAEFDPEELLARFMPGHTAHRVATGLQGLFQWGRETVATLGLDTAEYLREETGDLVHREDVDDWMKQVDAVRDGTDRLEARLRRLEAASAAHGGGVR